MNEDDIFLGNGLDTNVTCRANLDDKQKNTHSAPMRKEKKEKLQRVSWDGFVFTPKLEF